MILKIIGIILMLPFTALFIWALKESEKLRQQWIMAIPILALIVFIAGVLMLIFG